MGKKPRTPRIAVADRSWWRRWRRRREVLRLWRLAFGRAPRRVSRAAWPGLVKELERLQDDLARGRVQVENAA
jgi:hypothetical protein